MKDAIKKALASLDDLGDKAVRVRVLGLGAQSDEGTSSGENEMGEEAAEGYHPKAEATEQVAAEVANETRNEPEDDLMADPDVAERIKKNPELLALLKKALQG